jgi:putative aminopeptidase
MHSSLPLPSRLFSFALVSALACFVPLRAAKAESGSDSDGSRLARWVALDAPTGSERLATEKLRDRLQGWELDAFGNLIRKVGSGSPRRVIVCGLDSYAYAVSRIRDDGYLRLHRIGSGSSHPLWDQFHEGQQVRVLTADGPVLGVTGVANGHFAFQHRKETSVVTADELWLDVGAASAEEVAALGIRLLDPVVRHLPPWSYAEEVAGPLAGARVGCAAVASAASAKVDRGETVFVLSTQHLFGWEGASAAVARLGSADEVVFVGPGEAARRDELDPELGRRLANVLERTRVSSVRWIAPQVTDAGALMERITLDEARALRRRVAEAAGVSTALEWVDAPAPEPVRWHETGATVGAEGEAEAEADTAELLTRLVDAPAVSGHEAPVRAIVLESMPNWAKELVETDPMGNVWIDMGPRDTPATVFIAHMDEVGFEIESFSTDGTVSLRRRGGPVSSAWEGQPARIQIESASGEPLSELNGVFLARSEPSEKRPETMRAWFGVDGPGLEALGVRPGLGVTGYKEGHRIGAHRFTARALDDRAGTTALLLALSRIDPKALDHRVVFAWSVQEESGLDGAAALADRFGLGTRRAFSVDTFVSSDTPLESDHFAYAPLGKGPVFRAIESSSMAAPSERDRIPELASAAGVIVQMGLTQGGTDGTTFTFWGAPNAGLSWPGRYSHSPAEVLDLRDLVDLPRLILALAVARDGSR